MSKLPGLRILAILTGSLGSGMAAPPGALRPDWLGNSRIGAFMHYLPGDARQFARAEDFDVEALANQLARMGARYFIFTLGQNTGYFNAPNAAYDQATGYRPGDRCAKRDLPLELSGALAGKGIRLMLYLPCQPPYQDARAQKAFGFQEGPNDQSIDPASATQWARVIEEWSVRYGEKVSGWWFDGGYPSIRFNDEIGRIYSEAAKRGNPRSIVTFNPGIGMKRHTRSEDYTAGELNDPFQVVPESRWLGGVQWHALTFLGSSWGRRDIREPTGLWSEWVTKVTAKRGAVTLDVGPNMDPASGSIGAIAPGQEQQFRAIAWHADPAPELGNGQVKGSGMSDIYLYCDDEGLLSINGVPTLRADHYQRAFETSTRLKQGDVITARVTDLQGGPGGTWAILIARENAILATSGDFKYSTSPAPDWQTDPSMTGFKKPVVSDLTVVSLGNLIEPRKAWSQSSDGNVGTLYFKYVVP